MLNLNKVFITSPPLLHQLVANWQPSWTLSGCQNHQSWYSSGLTLGAGSDKYCYNGCPPSSVASSR